MARNTVAVAASFSRCCQYCSAWDVSKVETSPMMRCRGVTSSLSTATLGASTWVAGPMTGEQLPRHRCVKAVPLPLLITVSSGIASELDIALPSAWAGEWKKDRMLLESDASGHSDIYVLDTDTNSISRVTTNPANEWHPSWDATGQSIIFDSDRIGQLDLFRIEMDSLTVTQLTADSSAEQVGRLSPDGEFLAFHRHQGQQDYDVIVMSMKTNAEYTLTDTPGDDSYPDWDPSGRFIAYSSNRSGTYGIYLMCVTGKGTIQITGSGDKYPKWSPDGTSIAFQSNRDGALALYQIRNPKLPTCH